jgi:hypothetical protein
VKGKVVHCKRDPFDVLIDRSTKWGNPFSHKEGTKATRVVESRAEAIRQYRRWLWIEVGDGRITVEDLASLHGKTLGCWCKPDLCHGDVLVSAAAWAHEQLFLDGGEVVQNLILNNREGGER